MRASIIATSYNQLKTVKLMLASLRRQTEKDFEVILADDGSSDGTQKFCQEYCNSVNDLKLLCVTQEDQGYRKARICNEAVSRAQSDYLIFVDSDVILGKYFVEDHLALRRPDSFVCGRRVDLGPELTKSLSEQQIAAGEFDELNWELLTRLWSSVSKKDTRHWKRALRITQPWVRRVMGYHHPIDLLGSNMSMWKKDLIGVNGFNEALEAYWGEDGDLFIRLRNSGKTPVNGKGACTQYHLFHPRREPTAENVAQINALLQRTDYRWAEKGYSARFSL